MKRIEERPPQTSALIIRVLFIVIAVLVVVLIAGTIYGLVKKGKTAAPPPASEAGVNESIFSSLGTQRIPTADSEPETVIISIAFPYNKSDRPFSEELASRITWFKAIISDYFSVLTADEFDALDADITKTDLLERFNAELRLGQIRELYITDFMRL